MLPSCAVGLAPDLRKRIEIMAEHIARNGPDFENTVKQKNVNNSQFAFLYNGEGADYYNVVLSKHRAAANQAAAAANAASNAAVNAATTISAATATAPGGSVSAPASTNALSDSELAELVRRWKEPPVFPMAVEVERQLSDVISSLEQMASRDAIRSGRIWIENNSAIAQQIAGHIMKRIVFLPTCAHRLHVLYLVHDVLQTEAARKDSMRPLIRAFKSYLVWILRPAYQLALTSSATGSDSGRVLRLLQLWVERGIIEKTEAEEIQTVISASELPAAALAPGPAAAAQGTVPRPAVPPPWPQVPTWPNVPPAPMPPSMVGTVPTHLGMTLGTPAASHPQFPVAQRPPIPAPPAGVTPFVPVPGTQVYGYRNPTAPGGKLTPETVPVGVMATMLAQLMRRGKTTHLDFVPYKPLDPLMTPQLLPPMEVPSQRLLERIEDFYADLRDEMRDERSSSSSRSSSASRSRSPSRVRSRSRSLVHELGMAVPMEGQVANPFIGGGMPFAGVMVAPPAE